MSRARGILVALTLLAVACQPVDDIPAEEEAAAPRSSPGRGAPALGTPSTLAEMLQRAGETAVTWQDDPRPVEVSVELAEDRPVAAEVTYVAGGSDRLLVVTETDDGVGEERPTLGVLGLEPVTADAVEEVPDLPEGALDPLPLAEAAAPALGECGVDGQPTQVRYATGAPYAWTGEAWAEELDWTAAVAVTGEGVSSSGVTVDPVTGAALGDACFAVEP